MIKVYSKTVCPQCRMVKKFLDDKGITYEEINVENNSEAKEYLESANIRTVPVTVTPTGEMILGFALNELRELA